MSRAGWWFTAFTVACLGAAGAYIVKRTATGPPPTASATGPATAEQQARLDAIRRGPHVYFRSVRASEFGKVVVATLAALAAPWGARRIPSRAGRS